MMARAVVRTVDRVLADRLISPEVLRTIMDLWSRALLGNGARGSETTFEREYGVKPPWFLVLSPGHACNLRCRGCYAGAGVDDTGIAWSTLDRIISEAKTLWGIPLVVFSGGEPLAYRSEGKGVLDVAEKHADCMYLMFTNGTLIDRETAGRIRGIGGLTPALSVEGMREETDARRGSGVFRRVLQGMAHLREAGVPFGVSVTVTRSNCERILTDSFLDFFFGGQGAFYGFLFHYMPIGRSPDVTLMLTPQQRLRLWRRTWEVISRKGVFLFDFWNHATLAHGCLSAGREGGHFHIDWNGRVMPCVFAPYAGADINETYATGGDLNDVWEAPFFRRIRRWQRGYGFGQTRLDSEGDWLAPCPVRDHYGVFRSWVDRYDAEPEDEASKRALDDAGYREAMDEAGRDYAACSHGVWREVYL